MRQPGLKSGVLDGPFFQFENVVMLTALSGALLVYVILGFYARPVSDAYVYSIEIERYGIIGSQVIRYTGSMGRFSQIVSGTLFASVFDLWNHYFIVGHSVLVLLFVAMYRLLQALGRRRFGRRRTALAALFLLILFIDGMPSVSASVYWLGSATVTWAAAFSMLGVALLIENWDQLDQRSYRIRTSLAAGCMFYACGAYETLAVVNLIVLAAGFCWNIYFQGSGRRAWGWVLLISCIAVAVVVIAPGTWNRAETLWDMEFDVQHNSLGEAFLLSCMYVYRSVFEWSTKPAVICALIIEAGIVWPLIESFLPKSPVKRRCLLLLPIFWFSLMVASLWLLLLMIPVPLPRAVAVTYLLFLVGWLTTLPVYLAFAKPVLLAPLARMKGFVEWGALFAVWGAKLLFVLFLCEKDNTAQAWNNLRFGGVSAYARYHDALHRLAQKAVAAGQEHLVVPKKELSPPRITILSTLGEVSRNEDSTGNRRFAEYHGLQSVKLE